MPDETDLQANMARVQAILHQLQAGAGPRGATFAGRTIQPGDTPESIMGRVPAGGVPGEEGLMRSVPAIAGSAATYLTSLKEVIKGLKGKFPSSILERIVAEQEKALKVPNPRNVAPLTESQRSMMEKMSPQSIEKAVGMSRRPHHTGIESAQQAAKRAQQIADEAKASNEEFFKRMAERKPLPVAPYKSPGPTGELEKSLQELREVADKLAQSVGNRSVIAEDVKNLVGRKN